MNRRDSHVPRAPCLPHAAHYEAWMRRPDVRACEALHSLDYLAFQRLYELLPVPVASCYAELRLQGQQQLDLLVALDAYTKHEVVDAIARRRIGFGPRARSAWNRTAGFAARWTRGDDPVVNQIPTVWLEFDDVERPHDDVAPSLSACVAPAYRLDRAILPTTSREQEVATLVSIHTTLSGEPDGEVAESIARCVHALPRAAGRIIHLSVMTGRSPQAVKLYGVVPRRELVPYLRELSWANSTDQVEQTLTQLMPEVLSGAEIYFELNLTTMHSSGAATLGLAFAQQQCPNDPRRELILAQLLIGGQCSEDTARALQQWPSLAGLRNASERWLDLKVVIGPSGDCTTKAYLGMAFPRSPFARS